MKNRKGELPWASPKSRHDTNVRQKSPGLPAGAEHGYLLTVNMNSFCVSVWSRLLGYLGCEEPNTTGNQARTGQATQKPGWALLPHLQRAPGAVIQLFQLTSMPAPHQCAETAPRSATVPVFSWHNCLNTTRLGSAGETFPHKPGAWGQAPCHGDSTPCHGDTASPEGLMLPRQARLAPALPHQL